MSQDQRIAAMADGEAAAGAVVRAAAAHAKELKARTARAWRQLPDGSWQRIKDRGDFADPIRNWCARGFKPREVLIRQGLVSAHGTCCLMAAGSASRLW